MTISPGGRKPSGCGFAFVYFTGVTSLSIAGSLPSAIGWLHSDAFGSARGKGVEESECFGGGFLLCDDAAVDVRNAQIAVIRRWGDEWVEATLCCPSRSVL
jgi:hypothetical protein